MGAGEYLYHCVAMRYRILGSGIFQSKLQSLDNIYDYTVPPLTLNTATNVYPNQLTGFIQARMKLEFWVEDLDDTFVLKQIQFYIKPVASGNPQ